MKAKKTPAKKKKTKSSPRLEKTRMTRQVSSNTFLAFHKADLFANRMNYKEFFEEKLMRYLELYLFEMNASLNNLAPHERKFLEDCFKRRLQYKEMFISKATYYRNLQQYTRKFLTLFDFDFFHKKLAEIYNSTSSLKLKE